MDACIVTGVLITIIFILIIAVIVVISRKPRKLFTVPNRNLITFRQEALNKLQMKGYLIRQKDNGNIFVQKDNFSATTLVFEQNGQNVDVSYIHSNSKLALALFIVCFLTITILAIVIALIADSNSKNFRENELKPLLSGYGFSSDRLCPSCGRPIPWNAKFCPFCERTLN